MKIRVKDVWASAAMAVSLAWLNSVAIWSAVTIGMALPALAQGQQAATTKKVVQEAQQQLRVLGYDPGAADGVLGTSTVTALKKFQLDHGLPATGVLDQKTLVALNVKSVSKKEASVRGAEPVHRESSPETGSEESDWNQALLKGHPASFREFLRKHPNSSNVRIVGITIGTAFSFFPYEPDPSMTGSWLPKDRDEASRYSNVSNGGWGYAVDSDSKEISIYPLTISRASALGLRKTEEFHDSGGRLVGAKPPATPLKAKVLCVKDGSAYRIIDVEQIEQ